MVWDGRELRVGLGRSQETGRFQDCSAVMLEWFPCQKKKVIFPILMGVSEGWEGRDEGTAHPDTSLLPHRPG